MTMKISRIIPGLSRITSEQTMKISCTTTTSQKVGHPHNAHTKSDVSSKNLSKEVSKKETDQQMDLQKKKEEPKKEKLFQKKYLIT